MRLSGGIPAVASRGPPRGVVAIVDKAPEILPKLITACCKPLCCASTAARIVGRGSTEVTKQAFASPARRGFSYGAPLASSVEDGQDRGLFGLFLCARINEQFYTVLRWMQQTDFSDSFVDAKPGRNGQDRITGSRHPGGANNTPDSDIRPILPDALQPISLRPFIHYKGVVVLFVPSMATLREMIKEKEFG